MPPFLHFQLPCLTPAEREARPFKPRSSQVSSLKFPFLAGPYTGNLLQSVVMAAEHTPLHASVAPALAGCSYAAIDSVVHFKWACLHLLLFLLFHSSDFATVIGHAVCHWLVAFDSAKNRSSVAARTAASSGVPGRR